MATTEHIEDTRSASDPDDVRRIINDRGIEFLFAQFVDMHGKPSAKLVPAHHLDDLLTEGAGFAGFAAGDIGLGPHDPDMIAIPDPASLTILPWKPKVARFACDVTVEGEPWPFCPRTILRNALARAKKLGFEPRIGAELEYFLLRRAADGSLELADPLDTLDQPCYDMRALTRNLDFVSEVSRAVTDLGWDNYATDHEDANGQFEMNWTFDHALATADKHSFFKFMVKSIAEKHGLRATFMPKPFQGLTGNGCHAHISVWDETGKTNVFADNSEELGLSAKGRNFLGGIMKHASALAAITNPTVNSYKRINAPRTISGATWAPNTVTWTGNNRTHMVRVPGPGRFELRLPDGAANPYLLQAVIIAAGLDGIRSKADPGKRYDIDMYQFGHTVTDAPKLPLNLLDALREFDSDKSLKAALGEEFSSAYLKLKQQEWNSYASHFTQWERDHTLDI